MKLLKNKIVKFPFKEIKKPINDLMNSQIIRAKMIQQLEANLIRVTV